MIQERERERTTESENKIINLKFLILKLRCQLNVKKDCTLIRSKLKMWKKERGRSIKVGNVRNSKRERGREKAKDREHIKTKSAKSKMQIRTKMNKWNEINIGKTHKKVKSAEKKKKKQKKDENKERQMQLAHKISANV